MRCFIYLVFVAAVVAVAPTVVNAGTTGAVRGFVRDRSSQRPLSGVSVVMCNGTGQVQTSTDPTGFYALISMPPGPHRVVLRKDGYQTSVYEGINVLADQAITGNFSMSMRGLMGPDVILESPTLVNSAIADSVWAFGADSRPSYMRATSHFNSCGF